MFKIIADSACDISPEIAEEMGVTLVPFYVKTDSETYYKEHETITSQELYDFMVDHKATFPSTSLPSVADYLKIFESYISNGETIICVCLNVKFSGSYNSAETARKMLEEQHGPLPIYVIDSGSATLGEALFIVEICRMRDAGMSAERVVEISEQLKETIQIFFTVDNMDYLINGGRVNKVLGNVVQGLGLKPILSLKHGVIESTGVVRGRVRSMKKIAEQLRDFFTDNQVDPMDYQFVVGYGYDPDEIEKMIRVTNEIVEDVFASVAEFVTPQRIGATIGVHTGPYPLGVGLIKKYDR